MRWFRRHARQGARLALVALAIQFALSFGHFHGLAAQAAPASVSAPAAAAEIGGDARDAQATPQRNRADSQGHDQQPVDNCASCAVMALAGYGDGLAATGAVAAGRPSNSSTSRPTPNSFT